MWTVCGKLLIFYFLFWVYFLIFFDLSNKIVDLYF